MDRFIEKELKNALTKKIVLLSGPRQSGKTYLSKRLLKNYEYLNYDSASAQKTIREQSWSRETELVVFDELHKKNKWKTFIKGIYDTEGCSPKLLVTGSAKLDIHRKAGDSLAGRHRLFRLGPFTFNEAKLKPNLESIKSMLELGSFPEPLLEANATQAALWRKSYTDAILRQDLLDYKSITDFKSIEILCNLLAERVGSPCSYSSLSRDLEKSPHTIKAWLELLESLYLIFRVTPYSKNISKSLLKEPKFYFYDTGRVTGNDGAKLENLIAVHLMRHNHYREDFFGDNCELFYVRNKEKKEVDFLRTVNGKIEDLIEVKSSEDELNPSLKLFTQNLNPKNSLQIVLNLKKAKTYGSTHIISAHSYLSGLPI